MAPFHFWFPNVIEGLTWYNCIILITWQKIAPIIILSYLSFKQFFIFFIILSILLRRIGGLNQTSLRKIIAFSSINHIRWIMSALIFNESLWILYFLIYSIITFRIIFLFNEFKLFYLNQIFSIFSLFYYLKFFFIINFLSLGGLPPFMGFLPKWIIIQSLISLNQNLFILIIIIITLIILYFYLRISYSAFILNYERTNWLFNNQFKNKTIILLSIFSFFSISGLFIFILLIYNFY